MADVPLLPFMLILGVVWSALQLRVFREVYRYIPESRYLQFPMRLLCFIP